MSADVLPAHVRREQRIAAARAAREAAPTWSEPLTVTLGEVRSGDFLVRVPSQAGVVGVQADALVRSVERTHNEWGVRSAPRQRLRPVEAVRVELADERLADVTYPASFRAVVRRQVTS